MHSTPLTEAIALAAGFNGASYVYDGPGPLTPAEMLLKSTKIEAARERIKAAITYAEFEDALSGLHRLGVFLEDHAVSRVATAAVAIE